MRLSVVYDCCSSWYVFTSPVARAAEIGAGSLGNEVRSARERKREPGSRCSQTLQLKANSDNCKGSTQLACRDVTYARSEARAPHRSQAPEPAQNRPNHISIGLPRKSRHPSSKAAPLTAVRMLFSLLLSSQGIRASKGQECPFFFTTITTTTTTTHCTIQPPSRHSKSTAANAVILHGH